MHLPETPPQLEPQALLSAPAVSAFAPQSLTQVCSTVSQWYEDTQALQLASLIAAAFATVEMLVIAKPNNASKVKDFTTVILRMAFLLETDCHKVFILPIVYSVRLQLTSGHVKLLKF
jgi:hypothetical protein